MKAFVFISLSLLIHCSILLILSPTQNKQSLKNEHYKHSKLQNKADQSPPPAQVKNNFSELDLFSPKKNLSVKKSSAAKKTYRTNLIKLIQSKAFYPGTAKSLKHEGSVVLNLTVLDNGFIKNVAIQNSAPYETLNSAAIYSVKKIKKVEPLPEKLGSQQSFSIPIHYYL